MIHQKENYRKVSINLDEIEVDLILKALEQFEKRCKHNSNNARKMGYGKASSLVKADEWKREEEYTRDLASKISNQMI